MSAPKALETIGKNLEQQYQRWQASCISISTCLGMGTYLTESVYKVVMYKSILAQICHLIPDISNIKG